MWNVEERGFLPISDPIVFLPLTDIRNTELVHTWENLSYVLPTYLAEECIREELICDLRKVSQNYYHGCIDNLGGPSAHERIFLLLACFATAYINSPEGKKKTKLPKEIVVPFARVAHLVGRFPVLDYTSFILYNWKFKDSKNMASDNIEILQTFTNSPSEHLILSALVEMEFIGFELLRGLSNPFVVMEKIAKINKLLQKTWENVSVDFLSYWNNILSDYNNVKYEQWRKETISFPCDIFLQTPILAILYKYLDINFQNDYLKSRSAELVQCQIAPAHRNFINSISGIRLPCSKYKHVKEVYNNCLSELIILRNQLLFRNSDVEAGIIATKELGNHYL